MKHFNNKCKFS